MQMHFELLYLLNAQGLENVSLWVLQIQGRPKEAISSAGTADESERSKMKQQCKDTFKKIIRKPLHMQRLTKCTQKNGTNALIFTVT